MSINLNANVNVNQQSLRKLKTDLQKALSAVNGGGAGGGLGGIKMRLDDKDFTRPLGRITGQVSEFRKSLDASNARVIAFAASAGVLYKVSQAFDFVLKSTINVEKQLADINVVLGASQKNLQTFSKQLFDVAAKTGQSFQVVAASATEFSRQGLGMEQTLKRTRDALVLARLSGMDTVEATNALTAAVNSFSSAALTTTQVVNKLAAVDAAFAVSSTDLAEGLKRSAAAAESAGVSMDELLGIITAVQERTARGGAVIGNSFKTIFTRIQRPEVLTQLERLGVQVFDLQGKVRPAMEILKSFSKQFDNLSQSQQSVSAELVGGVFQVNNLKAALSDLSSEYSRYNKAVEIASQATDEAQRRNEALNDTLASRINILKVNAERVSSSLGDRVLKPVLDRAISAGNILGGIGGVDAGENRNVAQKFAQGFADVFLKTIGDLIAGPGLIVILGGMFKLLKGFGKFALESAKEFALMGTHAGKVRDMEAQIQGLLVSNHRHVEAIVKGEMTRKQVQDQIVASMREQAILAKEIAVSGKVMGAPILAQSAKMKTKSHGHVPSNVALSEIQGAYAGGYTPGQVRSMNIPGVGKVAYNTREKVKTFPGFNQPAIIPPAGSKAGVRYRRAFQSVNGFSPMPTGGVPIGGMSFGQSTEAQAQAAQAAYLQRVLYPGKGYSPQGRAGIASMANMGAASSGIKVLGSDGNIVNATKDVRRSVLHAYNRLLKELNSTGLDLEKERRVRQQLASKYKISDQSLNQLTKHYKEEARIIDKSNKQRATAAAVRQKNHEALLQQQRLDKNARQQTKLEQDQLKSEKQFRNSMIGAFVAPMVINAIGKGFQTGDPQTASQERRNRVSSSLTEGLGSALSMNFLLQGMKMHPYLRIFSVVLTALPSLTNAVKDFFDATIESSFNLEKATERLNKIQETSSNFNKGVSEVNKVLSGEVTGARGSEIISNFLKTASDVNLKSLTEEKRNKFQDSITKFLATGDKKNLDPVFGMFADSIESANEAVKFNQLNDKLTAFDAKKDPEGFAGLIPSILGARGSGRSGSVLDQLLKADPSTITGQDILQTGRFLSDRSRRAVLQLSNEEIDGLAEELDKWIETTLPVLQDAQKAFEKVNAENEALYPTFKENLKSFVDSYREFKIATMGDFTTMVNAIRTAASLQGVIDTGAASRAGQISSGRTVARLNRDSSLRQIDYQRSLLFGSFGQNVLKANSSVSDNLINTLQSVLSGGANQSAANFMNLEAFGGLSNRNLLTGNNAVEDFIGSLGNDINSATTRDQFIKYVSGLDDKLGQNLANDLTQNGEAINQALLTLRDGLEQNTKDRLVAEQRYVEEIKSLSLSDRINFGGGIGALGGQRASVRGLKFRLNESYMGIGGQGGAQMALQNLRELQSYYGSTLTNNVINSRGGDQLRQGIMSYHRQNLSSMGLSVSDSDLKNIANTQINNALKPQDSEVQLGATLSMNDTLNSIYEDGLKITNFSELVDKLDNKTGGGGGGSGTPSVNATGTSSKRKSSADLLKGSSQGPSPDITITETGQKSGIGAGLRDAFFFGKDMRSPAEKTLEAIEDVGEALRSGFASGLKEAIFSAENFGDALRSIGINVLDRIADKLFAFGIDAAFSATGQYLSNKAAQNAQPSTGAKGGYVTRGGIQRFASGGLVKGGSGFRDDVPAMLSQGEFVIRKSAVQKYGQGFLNSLNMAAGGAVISAPNTLIANDPKRPTDFDYKISSRLSAFAVTNENAKDVQNRRSLAERIMQNRAQYMQAMQAYKQEQRGRLIQGYISAAMILGAHGLSKVNLGGAGGSGGLTVSENPAPGLPMNNTGGFIRKYASGGYVDDVPAMLMGGEMVMNRDSVNRYGRGFFDKLNRGQVKMAEGGMVGGDMSFGGGGSSTSVIDVFDRLIESNEALRNSIEGTQSGGSQSLPGGSQSAYSAATNNVTININVDKTGATSSSAESQTDSPMNQQKDEEKARNMSESIRAACLDVIINEKRPGGALADLKSPRS